MNYAWNLDDIYPSWEAWEQDFQKMKRVCGWPLACWVTLGVNSVAVSSPTKQSSQQHLPHRTTVRTTRTDLSN